MTHKGLAEVRERWDAVARLGDRRKAQKTVAYVGDNETFADSGRRSLAIFTAACSPSRAMTLLEFGCGLGRVTQHLDALYKHVYAVDIAPGMVDAIRRLKLDNTTAICDDGTALADKGVPLYVDVVYSESVLLHNKKADVETFWPRVMARLRPGGRAFFQVPCYEAPRDPNGWIDVGVWTETELRQLAHLSDCIPEKIWVNPGSFAYDKIGAVHHRLHVFRRKDA